jgi:hypothetical protein
MLDLRGYDVTFVPEMAFVTRANCRFHQPRCGTGDGFMSLSAGQMLNVIEETAGNSLNDIDANRIPNERSAGFYSE